MNAHQPAARVEPIRQVTLDDETKRLIRRLQQLLTPDKRVEQVKRERNN